MDEPYIGEIRPWSAPFAPRNWAFCQGQALPVNQNQALFSLLGVTFGGNGVTTFNLPDLRSRVPVGSGQLTGGSTYTQGQTGGVESVPLTTNQIPAHTHPITGTMQTAELGDPSTPKGNYLTADNNAQYGAGPANATMGSAAQGTSGNNGSSQPHENRQPVLGINYIIALTGIYPSRA
ncbi:phage tail protein [Hymenobacter negativus]|uniref:Phage tail protein n=1 Tax=Hymenobacter negativus TaxID=2795026 RepID=A0ABS0Q8M7_9BACT|nr:MULTISPECIES: tail fiber protein [Bacteria]MBH8559024.1 phage tail protein [Hymenobacter negativus]MBH8567412.1 phage tail protein [Hymenobacter negativus]MBR7207144.1 phage tail protein [Microvirga sp. STS02]